MDVAHHVEPATQTLSSSVGMATSKWDFRAVGLLSENCGSAVVDTAVVVVSMLSGNLQCCTVTA